MNSKILQIALALLLLISVGTIFGETVWTGGGADLKWSTVDNWEPAGSPTGLDIVFFTNGCEAVGTVNNIIDADTTISSLSYTNISLDTYPVSSKKAHTTEILSGVTLTIDGSTSPVNAMVVGGRRRTSQYSTYVNMTGGGNLEIDAELSNFVANNPSSNHRGDVYLDMSGLSYIHAAVSNFYVGYGFGSGRARVYMYLPTSESETNRITATDLVVGDTDGNTGTDGDVHLYLGRHNEINADRIIVGAIADTTTAGQVADGYILFQDFSSGSTPTITIRGKAGGTSRADLYMAQLGSSSQEKNKKIYAEVDFRGGIVDALFGDVLISEPEVYGDSWAGSQGTLSMGAGTIDVTSITLGRSIYRSADPAMSLGILNVTGGVFRAGSMSLAVNDVNNGGATARAHGLVNVSGSGVVEVSGDVTMGTRYYAKEVIATVAVSNGTMTVLGNMAPASSVTNITSNVEIAGGDLFVTNSVNDATLRIENGTLSLIKGSATFDNLIMSNTTSVTSFEVSGTDAEDFATVEVNQNLELGGSLVVSEADGYTASVGDSWTVVSGTGTRTGKFETTTLLDGMKIYYTPNGFSLSVVGEGSVFLIQ